MKKFLLALVLIITAAPVVACDDVFYFCGPKRIKIHLLGSDGEAGSWCSEHAGYFIRGKKQPDRLFKSTTRGKLYYRGQACVERESD